MRKINFKMSGLCKSGYDIGLNVKVFNVNQSKEVFKIK